MVPMPKGFRVSHENDALVMRYTWFGAKYVYRFLIGVLWTGIVVLLQYALLDVGRLVHSVYLMLFLLMGLAIIYSAVAGFLNRTVIHAGQGRGL